MRTLLIAALALSLSACDVFGPDAVETATVLSIRVEALDLDQPWDSPLTGDLPDIYVDLRDDRNVFTVLPDYRTDVRENVAALPLTFQTSQEYGVALDALASLSVSDRDVVGDDLMFASGPFTFAGHYAGEARGETSRIAFENEDGRVVLSVRWD